MNESSAPAGVPESIYVSHQEFCDGLPAGRLRLIVNPQRAQKYIRHRLFVIGIALPLAGDKAGILGKRRDGVQIYYRIIDGRVTDLCQSVCTQVAVIGESVEA